MNPLWDYLYAFGQIFIVVNGQIFKNQSAHCAFQQHVTNYLSQLPDPNNYVDLEIKTANSKEFPADNVLRRLQLQLT